MLFSPDDPKNAAAPGLRSAAGPGRTSSEILSANSLATVIIGSKGPRHKRGGKISCTGFGVLSERVVSRTHPVHPDPSTYSKGADESLEAVLGEGACSHNRVTFSVSDISSRPLCRAGSIRGHSPFRDPLVDGCGVEADELADLEVGDSAFVDESADESFGDSELSGEIGDP